MRPAYRRRGYAGEILRQALIIARAEGVGRVLITCDANNIASAKVIERNGGTLEDVRLDPDGPRNAATGLTDLRRGQEPGPSSRLPLSTSLRSKQQPRNQTPKGRQWSADLLSLTERRPAMMYGMPSPA